MMKNLHPSLLPTTGATATAKVSPTGLSSSVDSHHHPCNRRRNTQQQQPPSSPSSSCPDGGLFHSEDEEQEHPMLLGDAMITIPMGMMTTCSSGSSSSSSKSVMRRGGRHTSISGYHHPPHTKRAIRRSMLVAASCWTLFFASSCAWMAYHSSTTLLSSSYYSSRAASSFQNHRHPLSHYHQHTAVAAVGATAALLVEPPTMATTATKLERRLVVASADVASSSTLLERDVASSSYNELRYLTFGSSNTWGAGLEEPTVEAYPYLLSTRVHNAGIKASRTSGSNDNSSNAVLAAACTQSIVQDAVYDVVVLEYAMIDEAVVLLAQRLRQRFPHATLIWLRLWQSSPSSSSSRRELPAGLDAHVLDLTSSSLTSSSSSSSRLGDDSSSSRLLSAQSHATVAIAIRALVESLRVTRHVDDDDHVLGDWNNNGRGFAGDYCNLWYDNGAFLETSLTRRLRPVEFTPPPPPQQQKQSQDQEQSSWTSLFFQEDEDVHKHALELDMSSTSSSSIRIRNPFSTPRMLYLSYLTTSITELDKDDDSTTNSLMYPHLRVRINGKPSVLLESWHSRATTMGEVIRTSAVGVLPGHGVESTIEFHSLLPTAGQHAQSPRPFRLLGASFVPDAVAERLDLEYTLLQTN
jgi:hypothetical protein